MKFLYFLQSIRCPVLDAIFSLITHGGEEVIFMAVGMIVFWCVNKYKGYYLLCVGFVGTVLNQFLKMLCRVPRPWIKDPNFPIVEAARAEATGYSFPSGHTQTSVGLYGGIARMTKQKILRIAMIALCVLVPFSRLYLGVHTPTDVLVSVAIALVLIFAVYPLFEKAKENPRIIYMILGGFLVLISLYVGFVFLYPFPAEVYAPEAIQNLESAQKNGATLLGCALGLLVAYFADQKWIHFETAAVWWAQILKAVGGLALVLAAKELLRAPLEAILGNVLIARGARYFLMVIVGGVLWPLTFRFFAGLGKKES